MLTVGAHTSFCYFFFHHFLIFFFIMDSIDLSVRSKSLVAVVGQVGAGKSSLISALLGEMEKRGGSVSTKVSDHFIDINL